MRAAFAMSASSRPRLLAAALIAGLWLSPPFLPHALGGETAPTKEPGRMHVALLGDSNTSSGGDDCADPRGWSKWFADAFGPLTCRSYARSGATWTHTASTRRDTAEAARVITDNNVIYNQAERLIDAVAGGDRPTPDLIIISAGTNDLWFTRRRPYVFSMTPQEAMLVREARNLPPGRVKSLALAVRYDTELLRGRFPRARIVLLSPMQSAKFTEAAAGRAGALMEDMARRLGLAIVRLDRDGAVRRAAELARRTLTADGVHTNPEGARAIGRLVAESLLKTLATEQQESARP